MRVRLERPAALHRDAFIAAARRSRALHADYVAPPDTAHGYRRFVRQGRLASEARFLSVTVDTAELAGVVTIGAVVNGAVPTASIGYYAFEPHAARGLMREAVSLAITYAFGRLGVQRLDASIRPDNVRSRGLAQRLGFRSDGGPLHEIRIGDCWYAHERWALYAEDWSRAAVSGAARLGPRRVEGSVAEAVEVDCRRQTE